MSREQQRYRERHYADRQCARCQTTFTPRSGNTRNCDHCGDLRHRSALLPAIRAHAPRERRYIMRPDFLMALPALRAELERLAPLGSRLMRRDYQSTPLTELPSFRHDDD